MSLLVKLTSGFGPRTDPNTGKKGASHGGTDYAVPVGTGIYPVAPGEVVGILTNDPISGHAIIVDHRSAGLPYKSSYVHLSRIDVAKGARVAPGQQIGLSGGQPGQPGAGKSTGPHLHLRIDRWDGKAWTKIDPHPLIDWHGAKQRGIVLMVRDLSGLFKEYQST